MNNAISHTLRSTSMDSAINGFSKEDNKKICQCNSNKQIELEKTDICLFIVVVLFLAIGFAWLTTNNQKDCGCKK